VTARSGCGRPPPARGVHELVALEENGPAVLERAVTDRAGAVSRTAPLHNPAGPLAYSRRIRLHLGCPILSLRGPIRVSSARVNPFVVPRHGTPARSGAGGRHGSDTAAVPPLREAHPPSHRVTVQRPADPPALPRRYAPGPPYPCAVAMGEHHHARLAQVPGTAQLPDALVLRCVTFARER
jgi:hypothetical protein